MFSSVEKVENNSEAYRERVGEIVREASIDEKDKKNGNTRKRRRKERNKKFKQSRVE